MVEVGLYREHQPASDGQRLLVEPGATGVDGRRRHAATASLPAVQRREADQPFDRQVQLPRRVRSRAEAVLRRLLAPGSLHAIAVHGRRRSGERVRRRPAATWTPTIATSTGDAAPATFRITWWSRCSTKCGHSPATGHLDAVLANWRVGVLQTLQSGPPFTVVTSANTTNAFPAGPLRPDLVGDPELSSDRADAEPLVQHSGVREPGGVHVRQLAAIGAARAWHRDDGSDARKVHQTCRRYEIRRTGRGLQPVQSRQLLHPGLHAGRR